MFRTRIVSLLAALLCLITAALPAAALEVDCNEVYCFSAEDFSPDSSLRGICITSLPEPQIGTVMLGSRVLRPGDILTAQQVSQMTFCPLRTETDRSAQVEYLPICDASVAPSAVMTIAIRGKEDKAPAAEDFALETYKNLPTTGKLKATDPEAQPMTYTVVRQPKRGSVTIGEDGSFTYTPKKNKIGVDSFTFTATDPAGKVSREATVTINILKPTDATQYTDTLGRECRFAAEWMRSTGIFVGETLAGSACFGPDKPVSRGEFTSMLVKALEIPVEAESAMAKYSDDVPLWLQPYLSAAVRAGLTAGLPDQEIFGADLPITGAEAAVMLQNALDVTVSRMEAAAEAEAAIPVWAQSSVNALAGCGITLDAQAILTRGETAQLLYQAVQLKDGQLFTE